MNKKSSSHTAAAKARRAVVPPRRAPALLDFAELPSTGDDWEAFARDFLVALGFAVDTSPNRGPDGGKDFIVVEHLRGRLGRYPVRWLVSCKHKALSGKAVSENDEPNILERVRAFRCDAFMGVYSTLPSSGLADRLHALRDGRELRDCRIFDGRLVENHLVRLGFDTLLLRYFPRSYKRIRPIHALTGAYQPLDCAACGRDMLEARAVIDYRGMLGFAVRRRRAPGTEPVEDVYWACKGECDRLVEHRYERRGCIVRWEDISDLAIPAWILRFILNLTNELRTAQTSYSDQAHAKMRVFITAMAQRVFREMTEEERSRLAMLSELPFT